MGSEDYNFSDSLTECVDVLVKVTFCQETSKVSVYICTLIVPKLVYIHMRCELSKKSFLFYLLKCLHQGVSSSKITIMIS